MLRYYITDRQALDGGSDAMLGVLRNLERLADSIDYVQVREKDLTTRELERFAQEVLKAVHPSVRVLINDRADVAIACGAHGVHLRGNAIAPSLCRKLGPSIRIVSISCHSVKDVIRAEREGADLALLAPIFDKPGKGSALGLDCLHEAASAVTIPVIALGGITTRASETACVAAGAAGIAGIRRFQAEARPGPGFPGF